ncbi:hypothetical protein M758_4G177500 [Ceratodon purpureus]|nr:hypothetical protein M758_4G177500 [Ceratodon purpureus]
MGGSVVRGLLSSRHSSSLVCLTAHSFLPSSSSWPGSAGAGAVTFVRRARFGCIRVREHAELGLGSGLRLGRSLLGVRALSGGRRGGGADALGVGVSKMSRRDPVVCSPSASSSAAEASSSSENVQAMPKVFRPVVSFCQSCGGTMEQRIPEGEHEMRAVCSKCGSIHYQNPKMVVGCLVEHENKVLLCRRSIEPSYGLWTLPAGYMELGESAAEGAARETLEEAQADVEVVGHFAHLDIPLIGQSYIIFRARFKQPVNFSPGPESLECALFSLDEIPFDSIAFSSITVALKMFIEDVNAGQIRSHHGVIVKRPGASPSDPTGYVVRDHLSV